MTLHFAKGKLNLGSVPGHAYISGQELVLVFPVTRLVEVVTALGSKASYFSTATTLLSKYKNVYVGFAFSKYYGLPGGKSRKKFEKISMTDLLQIRHFSLRIFIPEVQPPRRQ